MMMDDGAATAGEDGEAMGEPFVTTLSLPVPHYKIGWIVGKGGSYIQQLSLKSGAQVSISDKLNRDYGIVWKYVVITGSTRAVDQAQKLLHIRLERFQGLNFVPVAAET